MLLVGKPLRSFLRSSYGTHSLQSIESQYLLLPMLPTEKLLRTFKNRQVFQLAAASPQQAFSRIVRYISSSVTPTSICGSRPAIASHSLPKQQLSTFHNGCASGNFLRNTAQFRATLRQLLPPNRLIISQTAKKEKRIAQVRSRLSLHGAKGNRYRSYLPRISTPYIMCSTPNPSAQKSNPSPGKNMAVQPSATSTIPRYRMSDSVCRLALISASP